MVLFGPFWRSYAGQIYGRSVAPTPFRTVSRRVLLGNWASDKRGSRKPPHRCVCTHTVAGHGKLTIGPLHSWLLASVHKGGKRSRPCTITKESSTWHSKLSHDRRPPAQTALGNHSKRRLSMFNEPRSVGSLGSGPRHHTAARARCRGSRTSLAREPRKAARLDKSSVGSRGKK